MAFVRGARIKEPDPLTFNQAMFVSLELFIKENPGSTIQDWLLRCQRAWLAYEISSTPSIREGKHD